MQACCSPRPGVYWRLAHQRTRAREERMRCDVIAMGRRVGFGAHGRDQSVRGRAAACGTEGVKMAQWLSPIVVYLAVVLLCGGGYSAAQTVPGGALEARDMALVGFNDLQGRSAYQQIIQQQGGQLHAYIGIKGWTVLHS